MESLSPSPPAAPSHRDLYLLAVGILAGVLLGPAVLGRVRPDTYARWFVGSSDAHQIDDLNRQIQQRAQAFIASGATQEGLNDQLKPLVAQRDATIALLGARKTEHVTWLMSIGMAMVAAVAVLMVMEPVFDPAGPRSVVARSWLVTSRYVLIAAWIALLLAQPELLHHIPIVIAAVPLAVALIVAAIPALSQRPG